MVHSRIALTIAIGLLAAAWLRPQGDSVATYSLRGERRSVSKVQLALELAMHLRLRPEGQEAIQFLVNAALIELEASAQGVTVSEAEVDATLKELARQFEAQGKDFGQMLERRGYSPEDYREQIATGLLHRKLTQKALGRDQVDGAMTELWSEDARDRHEVITDPERLPPGVVARVDGKAIGLRTLGELLMRTQGSASKEERIRKVVAREIIKAQAEDRSLRLSIEEIDAEIERRRAEVEANPRYAGVPFEKLLESLGHSVSTLRASPDFRAQILLKRLVELDHPRERLVRELRENRAAVLLQHGARRQLEVLFLRAAETPTEFVPRTFEEAESRMETLREGIVAGAPFGTVARLNSDDPGTKARDGALGWRNRADAILPSAVMEAAFAAEIGGLTPAIRGDDGVYLVRVAAVEPPPTDGELIQRMQSARIDAATEAIFEGADIRFP